ncbi:hypothetical protein ABD76_05665 [Paenibacillus dendritiformis]|uniref:hypothetical protein n=1 Tax=Paenibacillus dendritiformis TaxID=130049 RepID=UPI0018CE2B12|nr:hypothetical protein [Paenibacillus dendritiformis]MBG9792015.1 hypothetical protein [Paenibacillus dendritiformis]
MTAAANTEIVAERDIELNEENIRLGFQTLNNLFKENPFMRDVLWKSLEKFFERKLQLPIKTSMSILKTYSGNIPGKP